MSNADPARTGEPVIRFDQVSKDFRGRRDRGPLLAVDDVSLSVEQGDIYGIVGFSGAGKSTLLRLVNGLERPSSGRVVVEGVELASLRGRELRRLRRRIGMIHQQFNLMASRTVFRNVAFPLTLARTPRDEIRERVAEVLDYVGLADKARAFPDQLSGGQKQRVGIARALAARPDILISDEATSALDPQTTDEVLELLERANRDYGLTVLLITHEMDVVRKVCNRVAVMQDGRIVEEGTTFELFSAPQTDTARRFVGSAVRDGPSPALLERARRRARGVLAELPLGEPDPTFSARLRETGVDFLVHYGSLEEVRDRTFGRLLVELVGPPAAVQGLIAEFGLRTIPEHAS
ncbi:methionine ABC transporter ATP-binding protein [Agromyces silvae]|uniref:methionine ABC transporter ATP-binding protein n=1 Tax=Agromyces silvae TaxID=3388266 RepID=UPI00280B73B8|nr:methionine ABC transporter ATP-binding protein [Agromyces protaetiae]